MLMTMTRVHNCEVLISADQWIIVKCYQPEAGVGADKVHTASVVLREEVVVGGDLCSCSDEDQVVDGEIIVTTIKSRCSRTDGEAHGVGHVGTVATVEVLFLNLSALALKIEH